MHSGIPDYRKPYSRAFLARSRSLSLLLSVRNRTDIPGKSSPYSLTLSSLLADCPLLLSPPFFLSSLSLSPPLSLDYPFSRSLSENEMARDSLKSSTRASSLDFSRKRDLLLLSLSFSRSFSLSFPPSSLLSLLSLSAPSPSCIPVKETWESDPTRRSERTGALLPRRFSR